MSGLAFSRWAATLAAAFAATVAAGVGAFLVLALLAAVGRWEETPLFSPGIRLGAGREGAPTAELPLVPAFLFVFCAGCLGLFLLYYPIISGAPTTRAFADALELLPDWHFA